MSLTYIFEAKMYVACYLIDHIRQISQNTWTNMIIKLAIFFLNFFFKETFSSFRWIKFSLSKFINLKSSDFPKHIKHTMICYKYFKPRSAKNLLLFQIVKIGYVNHDIMSSLNIFNYMKMHVPYRLRLSNILSPRALDDIFQNPIN